MWSDCQNRARDGSKDFFGYGAKQELSDSRPSPCADHHEINVVFFDGRLQAGLYASLFDPHLGGNSCEDVKQFLAVPLIASFLCCRIGSHVSGGVIGFTADGCACQTTKFAS